MTIMRSDSNNIFIDTNVLVYATIKNAPLHLKSRTFIEESLQRNVNLWISPQVIREYWATITNPRNFSHPLSVSHVTSDVKQFLNDFMMASDDARVTRELIHLGQQHNVVKQQIHDTNIVATMRVFKIHDLVTHNVKDFQMFSAVINIIPL